MRSVAVSGSNLRRQVPRCTENEGHGEHNEHDLGATAAVNEVPAKGERGARSVNKRGVRENAEWTVDAVTVGVMAQLTSARVCEPVSGAAGGTVSGGSGVGRGIPVLLLREGLVRVLWTAYRVTRDVCDLVLAAEKSSS
ncbi:hypothetical protein C6341_g4904 [Phytophthora cactorum]|nr:hypothetical protein C6341_g4904 [Phytophthora cactorum]